MTDQGIAVERMITADTRIAVLWDVAVAVMRRDAAAVLCDDSEAGTIRLGATVAGTAVSRHATIEVGELRPIDTHAVAVPVTWRSTEHEHRFPTVSGIFELSGLSEHPPLSRLAFVGEQHAPLGVLGSIGDAAGGRALATASIQALTERASARLKEAVATRVSEMTAESSMANRQPQRMRVEG